MGRNESRDITHGSTVGEKVMEAHEMERGERRRKRVK